MSGGSMDYIYFQVEEAARMCDDAELSDLLQDAAHVLHEEEWWKSNDKGPDDYFKALTEFKTKWFGVDRRERLKEYVDKEIDRCRTRCYGFIGCREGDDENDMGQD